MLQWTADMATGHVELDTGARALVERTAQMLATDEVAALRQLMHELYVCTREHFKHEDALMREAAYPELEAHALAHRRTLERLDILCMDVGKGMLNKRAIEALMGDWARQHVVQADAALARFLAQAG